MPQAFIIMQIGNTELDAVCEKAIVPALEASGFEAQGPGRLNRIMRL